MEHRPRIDTGPRRRTDPHVTSHLREWLAICVPLGLIVLIAIAAMWPFLQPAPPKKVVIATGPEGTSYDDFAREYARYFAEHGITLEIRRTGGARENYALLMDPGSGVDAALVQGGTAPPPDRVANKVQALCTVSFEPLFILYRTESFGPEPVVRLMRFKGKRVAVGKPTGGTYWLSTPMLAMQGIGTHDDKETQVVLSSGAESAKMLKAGEVDAAFFAVSADTGYIADALATPGIEIASLRQAPAYATKFNYLTRVTLHEGSVNLARGLPHHDVDMVAPTTALIARANTHKAIVQLLVHAAQKVHARRDPLAPPGAFPTLEYTEVPVGSDARYFFTTKPGFLQQKLPFWLAQLIDRLLILIVPLLVIILPLMRLAPRLYQWRMQARVNRWYKRIKRLDRRLMETNDPGERAQILEEAEHLEREIAEHVKVPLSYMGHYYTLRLHLGYLRDRMGQAAAARSVALERA
jgi:TRAP-type uncharacterized transport system substrate-binding protein